jgi:hypothetical protein
MSMSASIMPASNSLDGGSSTSLDLLSSESLVVAGSREKLREDMSKSARDLVESGDVVCGVTVNVRDHVLVVWSEEHKHYAVYTTGYVTKVEKNRVLSRLTYRYPFDHLSHRLQKREDWTRNFRSVILRTISTQFTTMTVVHFPGT